MLRQICNNLHIVGTMIISSTYLVFVALERKHKNEKALLNGYSRFEAIYELENCNPMQRPFQMTRNLYEQARKLENGAMNLLVLGIILYGEFANGGLTPFGAFLIPFLFMVSLPAIVAFLANEKAVDNDVGIKLMINSTQDSVKFDLSAFLSYLTNRVSYYKKVLNIMLFGSFTLLISLFLKVQFGT
jgi:hypothetical protein